MKSTSEGKENLGQHLQKSIGSYVQVWKAEQEGVNQAKRHSLWPGLQFPMGSMQYLLCKGNYVVMASTPVYLEADKSSTQEDKKTQED